MLDCAAWQALSLAGRAAVLEVFRRHNGSNNGKISLSVREAAKRLGVSPNTAVKALHECVSHGFLKVRQRGAFSYKARHATIWELTAEACGDKPPTKEFMRWGQEPSNQNAVSNSTTDGLNPCDRGISESPENPAPSVKNCNREAGGEAAHGVSNCDTYSLPGGEQGRRAEPAGERSAPTELRPVSAVLPSILPRGPSARVATQMRKS